MYFKTIIYKKESKLAYFFRCRYLRFIFHSLMTGKLFRFVGREFADVSSLYLARNCECFQGGQIRFSYRSIRFNFPQ